MLAQYPLRASQASSLLVLPLILLIPRKLAAMLSDLAAATSVVGHRVLSLPTTSPAHYPLLASKSVLHLILGQMRRVLYFFIEKTAKPHPQTILNLRPSDLQVNLNPTFQRLGIDNCAVCRPSIRRPWGQPKSAAQLPPPERTTFKCAAAPASLDLEHFQRFRPAPRRRRIMNYCAQACGG